MATKTKVPTKTSKGVVIKTVIITVLACSILAGAVVYHFVTLKNEGLHQYNNGMKNCHDILVK